MKLALIFLALALIFVVSYSEGLESEQEATTAAPETEVLSIEQLAKLPIKKLRVLLSKKGLQCKGCSEKSEFVTKVYESQGLPDAVVPVVEDVKTPPAPPAYEELRAGQPPPPGVSQEKMDELMAKLKMGGFGNSRMFSGDDLKNMSPEDLSDSLSGKGGKGGKGGKSKRNTKSGSKGKSKNSKSKATEPVRRVEADEDLDGSHTIEL